jgi:hypothetical protein
MLGAKLAFLKPDNPNEFLLEELRRIQQMKANNEPITLFTDSDFINLFSIFDLTGRGYITQLQYARGLSFLTLISSYSPYSPLQR